MSKFLVDSLISFLIEYLASRKSKIGGKDVIFASVRLPKKIGDSSCMHQYAFKVHIAKKWP